MQGSASCRMRDRPVLGRAVRLGAAAVLSAGALAVAASSAAATPINPPFSTITAASGEAYGTSVSLTVATLVTQLLHLPPQTISTSPFPIVSGPPWGSYDFTAGRVPGVLNLGVLTGSTSGSTGTSGGVTSATSVASANVLWPFLRVGAVKSYCTVGTASYSGWSSIAHLTVSGMPIIVTGYPNQEIYIPGVGSITLNEQIPTITSGGVDLVVNAIDIRLSALDQGSDILGGQVIIGHSECNESGM